MQRELRPSTQREDRLTMETKLEQIAVKAVNQLPKSVVREIRTPRSVGAGGGRPPPATRWARRNPRPYRDRTWGAKVRIYSGAPVRYGTGHAKTRRFCGGTAIPVHTDCVTLHGSMAAEPSRVRSKLALVQRCSDADDHRTELYAAPIARFTKFGDASLTSDLRSIAEVRRTSQNFEFVQGDAGAERQNAFYVVSPVGVAHAIERSSPRRVIGGRGREQVARRGFLNDHRRVFRQHEPARHEVLRGNPDPVHVAAVIALLA